jgi:hypothetical protein
MLAAMHVGWQAVGVHPRFTRVTAEMFVGRAVFTLAGLLAVCSLPLIISWLYTGVTSHGATAESSTLSEESVLSQHRLVAASVLEEVEEFVGRNLLPTLNQIASPPPMPGFDHLRANSPTVALPMYCPWHCCDSDGEPGVVHRPRAERRHSEPAPSSELEHERFMAAQLLQIRQRALERQCNDADATKEEVHTVAHIWGGTQESSGEPIPVKTGGPESPQYPEQCATCSTRVPRLRPSELARMARATMLAAAAWDSLPRAEAQAPQSSEPHVAMHLGWILVAVSWLAIFAVLLRQLSRDRFHARLLAFAAFLMLAQNVMWQSLREYSGQLAPDHEWCTRLMLFVTMTAVALTLPLCHLWRRQERDRLSMLRQLTTARAELAAAIPAWMKQEVDAIRQAHEQREFGFMDPMDRVNIADC